LSGNRVSLRYKKLGVWHDVTRNEYNQKVRRICVGLVSLGLKPGREADAVNKPRASVETIKKFTILSKKLYEEDGEMTPTMKVKRKYINQAFEDLIEPLYEGGN
jgi:long-subunit acyl-CoA synthetase (AMP-forming)